MKYQANPVVVDAFPIRDLGPIEEDGRGDKFRHLLLEDGRTMVATGAMLARIALKPGDYWVVQADGYVYLNPKDVFERKYRPQREPEISDAERGT